MLPFLGHLLLVLALVGAAASPVTRTAAQTDPSPKAIVFVQGIATTLDTGTFTFLRSQLTDPAWGYTPGTDFQDFSYTGGALQGGVWRPNPYPCEATMQDLDVSVSQLYTLLREYHTAHPDTRLVVVSHSLGGIVSFHLLDRLAADPDVAAAVDAIITVDSPVGGFAASNIEAVFGTMRQGLLAAPDVPDEWCGLAWDPFSHPVVNQVAALAGDARTVQDNGNRAQRAQQLGIRLVTLGNETDCLFAPVACLGVGRDQPETQHVADTLGGVYRGIYTPRGLGKGPCLECIIPSHGAILHPASDAARNALADVLRFIGPQTRGR
jgi:pimeloyl-ACP methyl ester carboxylesterase